MSTKIEKGKKKVKKGNPSPKKAQGARKPRPSKPFRLEVGKTYVTRNGKYRVEIFDAAGCPYWPFRGRWIGQGPGLFGSQCTFSHKGRIYLEDSEPEPSDLVKEVREAKPPRASARGPKK